MTAKHQRPEYRRARRALKATITPDTRCWRCGLTMAERHQTHPQAVWHAGHPDPDTQPNLVAAECSTCNLPDGARRGNRRRNRKHHSRDW